MPEDLPILVGNDVAILGAVTPFCPVESLEETPAPDIGICVAVADEDECETDVRPVESWLFVEPCVVWSLLSVLLSDELDIPPL